MERYKTLAREARIKILEMVHRGQTSHIGSNFSVIDIATVIYENLRSRDKVVWSKGWAAASIYYFLAKQGVIPKEDLEKFPNDPYIGLAETTVPGVLVNGGSVGHGLSVAVGIALGKQRAHDPGLVYCIMSDGEMNEGSVWEAVMLAKHHNLNNLIVFVDANKVQAMGNTREIIDIEPIENRWMGFGWNTVRIHGHDFHDLHNIITTRMYKAPRAVICDTIKGKGVSFMEGLLLFHYKNVDDDTYARALAELQ